MFYCGLVNVNPYLYSTPLQKVVQIVRTHHLREWQPPVADERHSMEQAFQVRPEALPGVQPGLMKSTAIKILDPCNTADLRMKIGRVPVVSDII